MPQLDTRRLLKIGGAYAITIPGGWVRFHGLQPGDTLEVVTNGVLTVKPQVKTSAPPPG